MQCEGDALALQRTKPRGRFGAIRSERLLAVNLATEVDKVAVHARKSTQRLEPSRLVRGAYAIVLDRQPMVETRMNRLQLRECVEHRIDRLVAVGMGMNLHACVPERQHALGKIVPRNIPTQAVTTVQVPGRPQPQRHGGVRTVAEELYPVKANLVGRACV